MRILTVGNMYPPHHLGGYELAWQGAVTALRRRGHDVAVLTTDFRREQPDPDIEDDPSVERALRWYWHDHEFPRLSVRQRLALERHNQAVLESALAERPDAVAWWSMGGMSLSLLARVAADAIPSVGFVHDTWPAYSPIVDGWHRLVGRNRVSAWIAQTVTGVPATSTAGVGRLARWVYVSESMRGAARAAEDAPIASSGVDLELFGPKEPGEWRGRFLAVGRIDPRKGFATAISAVAQLEQGSLRIVGSGQPDHAAELQELAAGLGLSQRVELGAASRGQLPGLYADADALLFPVEWDEPWGLVPLEAMACGCPVIATGTGGSAEFLRDGENALVVGPADPDRMAAALGRLADDPDLRARLRAGGLVTAAEHSAERFHARVLAEIEAVVSAAGGGR